MKRKILSLAIALNCILVNIKPVNSQSINSDTADNIPYCFTLVNTRTETSNSLSYIRRLYRVCSADKSALKSLKDIFIITEKIIKKGNVYYLQTTFVQPDGSKKAVEKLMTKSELNMETNFGTVPFDSVIYTYNLQNPTTGDLSLEFYFLD